MSNDSGWLSNDAVKDVRNMSSARGLSVTTEPDGRRFKLAQRPFHGWVMPVGIVSLAAVALGATVPGLGSLTNALGLLIVILLLAWVVRTRVVVDVGASRLLIRGWIGRLPRPGSVDLPMRGVRVLADADGAGSRIRLWTLTVDQGDTRVVVRALRCTPDELREVKRAVHSAAEQAPVTSDVVPEELGALPKV